MKIINSKIDKEDLYISNINDLEDIINTEKFDIRDIQNNYLNTIYLINSSNESTSEVEDAKKDRKVLVLRNKFTNKLCDIQKTIEKYLEYRENNIEDPTYIAMEMSLEEYVAVKFKKETSYPNNMKVKNVEFDIEEKIRSIIDPVDNNETLLISEKQNRVYLPYTIDELEAYARRFPAQYPSLETVVEKEYMLPLNTLYKHPAQARFSETYYLIRKRERKNFIIALIYAIIFVTKSELNPAVIAACKSKDELKEYMRCYKENKLDEFKHFKVVFDESISA